MREYAASNFDSSRFLTARDENEAGQLIYIAAEGAPDGAYVALVYEETPLIDAHILEKAAQTMKTRRIKKLKIGKGFIAEAQNLLQKTEYYLDSPEIIAVTDAKSLSMVYNNLKMRIICRHLSAGVLINSPESVIIDDSVTIESGAVIEAFSVLRGKSVVKAGAVVGSFSVVADSIVGECAKINASQIVESEIGAAVTVGPYSLIRGGSRVSDGCRIGDFVEIKKSVLAAGVKAAHLAYIGDADIGARTNVGCGTVFANYNGKIKQKTTVGEDVFIGANANLVAPLNVGDKAFIAAGTTVTDDVSVGQFVIGRVRQTAKQRKEK